MELGEKNERYKDMITRSKKMITKCLNKVISEREISAPHVASFLLGFGDKYSSHRFKCLNLLSFLCQLQEYEDDPDRIDKQFKIETGNDGMIMLNETCDYLNRGKHLKSLSLYQYVANIEKVTLKSEEKLKKCTPGSSQKGRPANERFLFDDNHPQSKTHIQRMRTTPLIPRLTYLPPSPQSDVEKHSKCMLLLFKPFTSFSELLPIDTWENSFLKCNIEKHHSQHILNLQEMHKGITRKYELYQEKKAAGEIEDSEDDEQDLSEFDQMSEWYHMSEEEEISCDVDVPDLTPDNILTKHLEDIDVLCNAKNIINPFKSEIKELIDVNATQCKTESKEVIKRWKEIIESEKVKTQEYLRGNLGQSTFDVHIDSDPYATNFYGPQVLQSVIEKYSLNSLQERAFRVIGQNVLDRLNGKTVKQKLVYLGGCGGTGKSQVIKALHHFFDQLGMAYALRLSAYTGMAAGAIGGSTLCNIAGISSRSTALRTDMKRLESNWENVSTLVIDEVSMLSCELLAKLHRNLVKARHTSTTCAFAGIDVLFVGHFQQFPPVLQTPLYYGSDPCTEMRSVLTQTHSDREFGRSLWQQITDVIILKEQIRVTDKVFRNLLDRVAEGKGTKKDYKLLNTRLVSKVDVSSQRWKFAPVIVPGNALRRCLNRVHAVNHAISCGQKLLISIADDMCSRVNLTKSKRKQLLALNYTQAGNLPSELELYIGAPVMLTMNIAVELMLSNGSPGTITRIAFDAKNASGNFKSGQGIKVPKYVVVKFDGTTCPRLPGLEQGEIPVFPISVSYQFKFPGMSRRGSIRRWQLPLVLRFSYTSYKAQGKTLDCAIVDLNPANRRKIDQSFAYVPLSRVRKIEDIVILRPFPLSVLQAPQSNDLIAQNKKFDEMEKSK